MVQLANDVKRNWEWSDGFLPQVKNILAKNAFDILNISIATKHQDMKQATDMLITVSGNLAIAVRLRRPDIHFRDLTIRAKLANGAETELSKIRKGAADFFLYGWTDGLSIVDWILADLHKMRESGLIFYDWQLIPNKDNRTYFIAIPLNDLFESGCIVAHEFNSKDSP